MYTDINTAATPSSSLKRNILITVVMTAISVILCTLGFNTAAQPIDSIAVVWPGAILQAVGTILFGAWGIVATVAAGVIGDIIKVGTFHVVFGYAIPDFFQSLVPAIAPAKQNVRFEFFDILVQTWGEKS